jgi:hypothetical protein
MQRQTANLANEASYQQYNRVGEEWSNRTFANEWNSLPGNEATSTGSPMGAGRGSRVHNGGLKPANTVAEVVNAPQTNEAGIHQSSGKISTNAAGQKGAMETTAGRLSNAVESGDTARAARLQESLTRQSSTLANEASYQQYNRVGVTPEGAIPGGGTPAGGTTPTGGTAPTRVPPTTMPPTRVPPTTLPPTTMPPTTLPPTTLPPTTLPPTTLPPTTLPPTTMPPTTLPPTTTVPPTRIPAPGTNDIYYPNPGPMLGGINSERNIYPIYSRPNQSRTPRTTGTQPDEAAFEGNAS